MQGKATALTTTAYQPSVFHAGCHAWRSGRTASNAFAPGCKPRRAQRGSTRVLGVALALGARSSASGGAIIRVGLVGLLGVVAVRVGLVNTRPHSLQNTRPRRLHHVLHRPLELSLVISLLIRALHLKSLGARSLEIRALRLKSLGKSLGVRSLEIRALRLKSLGKSLGVRSLALIYLRIVYRS